RHVLTGSADELARVWDTATGKERLVLKGHTGHIQDAAYSPDGRQVVTAAEDRTARVWDAATGKEWAVLQHGDKVQTARVSPDGRLVVTAAEDGTAGLWDAATGKGVATLKGHKQHIDRAVFVGDGQQVLTVGAEARLWPVDPLPLALRRKPRELT